MAEIRQLLKTLGEAEREIISIDKLTTQTNKRVEIEE
jgi:hypothetical protein